MERSELVLAALAASDGAVHTPVQVQKLFFLIDQNIATHLHGGPFFDFQPKDFGPFDKAVYEELESLAERGEVEIDRAGMKKFRLAPAGLAAGRVTLQSCPPGVQQYLRELSKWVRNLSFADLVSAIYRQYPGMRVNSAFQG